MPPPKKPWKFRTPETALDRAREILARTPPPEVEPTPHQYSPGRSTLKALSSLLPGAADEPAQCTARRCRQQALYGSTTCAQHAPANTKQLAEAQLQAMAGPAVKRLEMLAHQNGDLKVSLNALTQILNRSLGAVGKDADAEKRPAIRIAIAVGGVPLNIGPAPPAQLPAGNPDEDDDTVLVVDK